LPYGIYQVAKSAARAAAVNGRLQAIDQAMDLFDNGANMAQGNVQRLRARAITRGQGMYTGSGKYGIRATVGQFLKRNKTAQMLYDKTIGGMGMYTGAGTYLAPGAATSAGPESNDLMSTKSTMDVVPLFHDEAADEGVLYSRREYVSEIYGPPTISGVAGTAVQPFSIQEFSINPGLEKTFPWLSQIAANFDEYQMQQLCFTFKSTTTESGNQVNGQVGTVIMATNYNAAAPAFDEKFTMMQYAHSVSGRLTESLQAFVECDPDKLSGSPGEYVRTNPVVLGQDLKTYDHGKFQIAIANCTSNLANQSIGELWVSYTVRLRKPKFYTGKGLSISKDIFLSFPSGSESRTVAMGSAPLRGQQNNIGCRLSYPSPNPNSAFTITFPASYAGSVKIMFAAQLTDMGTYNAAGNRTLTGNITAIADLYGPTNNAAADTPESFVTNNQLAATVPPTLSYIYIEHYRIQIATSGVDNSVTLNMPTTTGAWLQSYLEINEINTGFSYAANNLGSSDAPIWVTAQGTVTIP